MGKEALFAAVRRVKKPIAVRLRIHHERVPWDASYIKRRWRIILDALSDPHLLAIFKSGGQLPDAYGIGIDERCIEYPWFVANLDLTEGFVLDAGSTLNFESVLRQERFDNLNLHIMTLAPEQNCFWKLGISYLFGDLRDIPIKSGFYGSIACLSTLEHVGFDNSIYTGASKTPTGRADDFIPVIRELRRVLAPGAALLLTVPFGVYRNFGSFQVFDSALVERTVSAFQPAAVMTVQFFRYTETGWEAASEADCVESEYVEWVGRAHDEGLPHRLPVEHDHAAAARAVACIRLVKLAD